MFKTIRSTILLALFAGAIHAGPIYSVTLDTSNLSPAGTYFLGFQFGGGTVLGDNLVSLGNFTFGGGSASGVPFILGGASGSLASGVTITNSDDPNILAEQFTPGSVLQFDLTFTTNFSGGTPHQFVWSILDDSFTPIPTTSNDPLSPVLTFIVDSANPTISTYGAFFGNQFPVVTLQGQGTTTPEPGTWLLTGLGLTGMFVGQRAIRRS